MSYVLSEDVLLDLDGIWEFIAADSIEAADRWIGRLFDAFEAISDAPGIGHKREDLTSFPGSVLACGCLPHHLSRNIPSD